MAAFHTRIKRHRWGSHFWRSPSDSYSVPHLASAAVWAEVQKSPPKMFQSLRCRFVILAARLPPVTWVELVAEGARLQFRCNGNRRRRLPVVRLCATGGHSGVFSVRRKGEMCIMYSCRVFLLLTEQKFAIKAQLVWVLWQQSSSQMGLFFSLLSCKQPSSLCEPLLSQFGYFLQLPLNKFAIS